jgi:hypothetical protein
MTSLDLVGLVSFFNPFQGDGLPWQIEPLSRLRLVENSLKLGPPKEVLLISVKLIQAAAMQGVSDSGRSWTYIQALRKNPEASGSGDGRKPSAWTKSIWKVTVGKTNTYWS